MFLDRFKQTESTDGDSIISRIATVDALKELAPGVYNDGLFTVCDNRTFSDETLAEWSHLIGERTYPLGYSAWGDVYCVSMTHKRTYWLYPQLDKAVDTGQNVSSILDNLLEDDALANELLERDRFNRLRPSLPKLAYGQCYILKPYEKLGGDPSDASAYKAGDVQIYLSLAAQI